MNLQFGRNYNKNIPFSTVQRITPSKNIQMGNFTNKSIISPNMNPNINRINRPINRVTNTIIVSDGPKKMKWGEPTWFLLHTLCEKVKDDSFDEVRQGLLNTIYMICTNLPCPDCSSHAKQYLDAINYKTIQTKAQLKQVMFNFHNSVNAKKGFKIYNSDDLQKYSTAVTINIIYNFMNFYSVKNHSIHMISNDLFRNRVVEMIKEWFNVNIKHFSH